MSHDPLLARRDFLRAGTALLSGTALGLLPTLIEAAPDRKIGALTNAASLLTIGYWNGGRFVDASTLTSGDSTLESVRLTISSVSGGGIDALEAQAPSPSGDRTPFVVWVAPPAGLSRTRSRVALESDGSIVLTVITGAAKREIRLVSGRGSAAKLREGT